MRNSANNKKIVFLIFVISILTGSILILSVMLINITNTAESLAKSLINRTISNSREELDKYFKTIISDLYVGRDLCNQGVFDAIEYKDIDTYILPIFQNVPQLNTVVVADTLGNEYSLIREDTTWLSNCVYESKDSGMVILRDRWKGNNLRKITVRKWIDYNSNYDPRKRPWHIGAMSTPEPNTVWWTQPYLFFTHQIPGITISLRSFCEKTKKYHVIQYDILLMDISKFTTNLEISEHGKTFVLSNKYKVLGLPKEDFITNIDSIKKYILQDYDSVRSEDMKIAINKWKKLTVDKEKPFSFYKNGEKWWARISEYKLGINNNFIIGVIVPEKDFVEEINKTRNIVVGGFAIVLIFIVLIIRQNNMRRKTNILLSEQKQKISETNEELNQQNEEIIAQRDEIEKQKDIVEEIHHEISQSIDYATRLQQSIFPAKKLLAKHLSEYFVLFKPKDKVSGDFYWWTHIENHTIITAADCTGHGVPGAFMSMLGISFLREIVNKEYVTHPGVILRKLRKEIIKSLKQKGESGEQKDGMDMAIISIDHETNIVQFSGANNPLYIVKPVIARSKERMTKQSQDKPLLRSKGMAISPNEQITSSCVLVMTSNELGLYEVKPDKMPIAIYERMDKFATHEIQLEEGDQLYMFSDGFADQFGGPKGKKFKYKPFKQLIMDNCQLSMAEQKTVLEKTFTEWKGDIEQVDDIVVLGVKI